MGTFPTIRFGENDMIDINELKALCKESSIAVTKHAKDRMMERKIGISDVVSAIQNGEIIKQYEDDKPLPSCLILGPTADGGKCHAVVSHDGEFIYLITAYYPDRKIWNEDLKSRKETN